MRILKYIIIISLLFVQPAFSAVEWRRQDFFENSAGLNDGFAETAIEDNEASDLQNVVFTTSGAFKTRAGFTKLNSSTLGSSVVTTGLKYYRMADGTEFLVGVFDDDTIQKMDYVSGPDGTWDDITGTLTFSNSQNQLATFAIGEDILIIDDGITNTAPYKWTGTGNAAALGGSPPNASMVAFHKNMGFAAGDSANPSTLYFSDLGDIENWSTGLSGNVSVETNDGTIIRAIEPGFDALYIWKDRSIWRLTGSDKDSFRLQRMVSDIGCFSPNAVSKIDNTFFFTDSQGDSYIYDGAIKVRRISNKIQGTIDNSSIARYEFISTVVFDEDFYISFSSTGSGTHDSVLVFDSFNQAWTKFDGINANALAVANDGSGSDMITFGDYGGFVYKYPDGTNDAGTAIDTFYVTKEFRFPDLTPRKDWKKLDVFVLQEGDYNLSVEVRNDFTTSGTTETINLLGDADLYGTALWGTAKYSSPTLIIGEIEPNLEGRFFQVKFSNANVDEPFQIQGFTMFMDESEEI